MLIKRPPFDSSRHEDSNNIYYISVVLILTELFYLEYLNLQVIISRSSNWISINKPSFDSSYREESNDMCYISVALILTELFRFEFYNKNLILFTLFRPYFDLFRPLEAVLVQDNVKGKFQYPEHVLDIVLDRIPETYN